MKKLGFQYSIVMFCCLFLSFNTQGKDDSKTLKITHIELGYPVPAIPFYHFKAELEIPQSSIIEVEASVDGKVLRAVDLYKANESIDMTKPPLTHRPPSAYGLSYDGTFYKNFSVIGWVKWQPGNSYTIRLTVRMKKSVKGTQNDEFLSAAREVKAPEEASVFDSAWENYKAVVLSETAGIDRIAEPVEVLLPFYPDELDDLTREIRVVAVDSKTYSITEVPCQVYDIQEFMEEDDLLPDENGKPTRQIPHWLPTITARVAFLAEVPAKTSRVFLVYYNNEDAMAKVYRTDLHVQGDMPGLQIDNEMLSAVLHPKSGHLDQIMLKSKQDVILCHRLETNGAIHWNPGIYVPSRAWSHTADWNPPKNIKSVIGPVIATNELWDHLRGVPEADASVRYEFYPGVPYFIAYTTMRINQTVGCMALRNAEIVFKRNLMTHAAWYDIVRGNVIVHSLNNLPDLTDIKMEADIPWITFYNEKTGIGFAGINLSYVNAGLENRPRLLNPYLYVTVGPWVYWSRALSMSFLSSNMQQVIPVMQGNFFSEKWAYLLYELDNEDIPFKAILDWQTRLTNPLRIHLVEEVDDRVSYTLEEFYMDDGKTGWENRETGKHRKE
jgi:hypothetical protein